MAAAAGWGDGALRHGVPAVACGVWALSRGAGIAVCRSLRFGLPGSADSESWTYDLSLAGEEADRSAGRWGCHRGDHADQCGERSESDGYSAGRARGSNSADRGDVVVTGL